MTKTISVSFSYKEFENSEELKESDKQLIMVARKSAEKAYAPYSKFRVGAAVELESGLIISGANVENAAFPSGICAERSALANSISNYPNDKPVAIAIVSMNSEGITEDFPSPCGNCRQVIAEEESRIGDKIRIILSGKNKTAVIDSISDLLPLQFNKENLKVNLP